MNTMTRRFGTLLLCLAMLATACGGGSAASDVTTSSDGSSAAPSSDGDDTQAGADASDDEASSASEGSSGSSGSAVDDGATSMAASSPIGAFFADDGGFDAAIAEYTVRVEEAIVICMAAQGFEFARSEGAGFGDNSVAELQSEMTVREWTSEFGFGISTSFDSIAQNQTADPNTEIFLGMSESEREIWIETLTGGGFEAAGGDFNSRPLEDQGCVGQALIETGGQEAIEGLEDFGDVYEEGEKALFERREMVDAVDAWSRCMSTAGYVDYAKLDDPEEDIAERFELVTAPLNAAIDELTPEEGQALISGESFDISKLPGLDVDALRELQDEEIELALADLDCYEADVQEIFEPLRDEFETGLLDEYAVEFDALRNIGS